MPTLELSDSIIKQKVKENEKIELNLIPMIFRNRKKKFNLCNLGLA